MISIKKSYKGTLFYNDVPFLCTIHEIKFPSSILKHTFKEGVLRLKVGKEPRVYRDVYSYSIEDNVVKIVKLWKN